METVCREVGEMMHRFGDKKEVRKNAFFRCYFPALWRKALQVLRGACHMTL